MIFLILSLGVVLAPMIFGLIRSIRRVNRITVQAERAALPFDPKTEPMPNALLRRFPLPERTYLRQQLAAAGLAYLMASWFFTIILSVSLVPHSRWIATSWTNPSALAWFQYVQSAATGIQLSLVFCGFAMAAVLLPLRQRPYAQFYRTRPLSSGFVFWVRVLPRLAVAIASTATGAALSLALLTALKGPVWQHLPSTFPGIVSPDDYHRQLYSSLLATSLPRVFLSLCTTVTLLFGIMTALIAIPLNRWIGPNSTPIRLLPIVIVGMLAAETINALDLLGILHLPPELFLYTHLGPPPPYAFATIPVLLSAGLVLAARFLNSRLEL